MTDDEALPSTSRAVRLRNHSRVCRRFSARKVVRARPQDSRWRVIDQSKPAAWTERWISARSNDSSLSAAQLAAGAPHDSLAATISDNTAYTLAASYTWDAWKFSGGYEHIKYENPSLPITNPFSGLGGYYMSVINNNAFAHDKVLQVSWVGAKYSISKDWDITGAWYHYNQNSFKGNGCSDTSASSCSGTLNAYSLMTDYRLSKRFDVYAGAMWSKVNDGLASGFLHTSTVDPMVGARFKF